jgi:hypothetical protein
MARLTRILAVTAGLCVLGGIAGALAGAVVAQLVVLLLDGPRALLDFQVLGIGATIGAPLGAALLPLAGWLLMRHVPLGRAALGTIAGTIVGGLLGWFLPVGTDDLGRSLLGGAAGFTIAVLALRRSAATSALVALIAFSESCSRDNGHVLRDYTGSSFQAGQVWGYKTRPGEDSSTLTVVKVESHPKLGTIVHLTVNRVRVRNPAAPGGYTDVIGHMPFTEEAVRRSVSSKISDGAPTERGMEGYRG